MRYLGSKLSTKKTKLQDKKRVEAFELLFIFQVIPLKIDYGEVYLAFLIQTLRPNFILSEPAVIKYNNI